MNKKSLFINPLLPRNPDENHRAATPLELLYDLVYVVAIATLAHSLNHTLSQWHHVGHSLLMYILIFWAIWWPWNSYTWFSSQYDTDDVQFRIATFVQMIGAMIMAVGVESAYLKSDFMIIMIGYVIMRIPTVFLWFKVAKDDKKHRVSALRYAYGILFLQIAWSLMILFYFSWFILLSLFFLSLLLPIYAESANKSSIRHHSEHIEERFGLLTIIVLGESIVSSIDAIEKLIQSFHPELFYIIGGGTITLFSMWWLYFDIKVADKLNTAKNSFIFGYGHFILFASAAATGALLTVNTNVIIHEAQISAQMAAFGFSITVALYLFAVWCVNDLLLDKKWIEKYELLILAILILFIGYFFASIILIGIALILMNIIRVYRQHLSSKV